METKILVGDIVNNIDDVIKQETEIGKQLWKDLLALHSADIAQVCTYLTDVHLGELFALFPKDTQLHVFEELPIKLKEKVLLVLDDSHKASILRHTPADDLTDIFDLLSDEDLKKSLEVCIAN